MKKRLSHLAVAALALFLVQTRPQTAEAAFAPTAIGNAIERSATPQIEQVRRGGGGFRGMRGGGRHFGGGFRGGGRWGHGGPRRHWGGVRRGWGGVGWGVAAGVPLGYYGYSCIRRGWVWNGYRYVWRRYRVC